MAWRRLNGQPLNDELVQSVEKAIHRERESGHNLKLCIGTDSQKKGKVTEYATVIVFLREKKGGFMFIKNAKEYISRSVKERMIVEVAKSVEVAYQLCEMLDKHDIELEVHADINTDPQFKSNSALKEAMGYILSMGFVFKAKPHAFASSSCADKVV
jgi:predicted RNase H-related nuclease YkuK (DUF458 family)